MLKIKFEHIAVGYNSEEEADKFFIDLLRLNKIRSKSVPYDLMEKFFGQNKQQKILTYSIS